MQEPDRMARNHKLIAQCWRPFGVRVQVLIDRMWSRRGFRTRAQSAHRPTADQLEAFRTGHSTVKYGFHNVTGKGGVPEALAVDLLNDDQPLNPSKRYLMALAIEADQLGLETGITWGLPRATKAKLVAAIKAGDVNYSGKIGWDPTHTQPKGFTIAQARMGLRPQVLKEAIA